MHIRIDLYHHFSSESGAISKLDQILALVKLGNQQGGQIIAKVDELLQELVEANTATNEIASDLDDLIAKLSGGLSASEAEAVKTEIAALKTRLQGVAATHTA